MLCLRCLSTIPSGDGSDSSITSLSPDLPGALTPLSTSPVTNGHEESVTDGTIAAEGQSRLAGPSPARRRALPAVVPARLSCPLQEVAPRVAGCHGNDEGMAGAELGGISCDGEATADHISRRRCVTW